MAKASVERVVIQPRVEEVAETKITLVLDETEAGLLAFLSGEIAGESISDEVTPIRRAVSRIYGALSNVPSVSYGSKAYIAARKAFGDTVQGLKVKEGEAGGC